LQVVWENVEEFLHAGASVEQGKQESLITDVVPPMERRLQHGGNFLAFQIVYGASRSSLDRYGEKTLSLSDVLGIARGEKTCERMNCGEPGVASSNAVLPLCFKMFQKGKDVFSPEVSQIQIDYSAIVMLSKKP
jgi:hypothetical protein